MASFFCCTFAPDLKITSFPASRDSAKKDPLNLLNLWENMTHYMQLIIAAIVSLAGIALLFVGAYFAPQGEIHESILVAFGEIATFAGSIIGIDYHYKAKDNDKAP